MKSSKYLLAATFACLAQPVVAADGNGLYAVRGLGSHDCAAFVANITSDTDSIRIEATLVYNAWISGYLTGINRSSQNTFDSFPAANDIDLLPLVVGECKRQSEAVFEQVLQSVIGAFHEFRVVSSSPIITSESHIPLREELIRRAQDRLIALGHLTGTADGQFGPRSRAALRVFQATNPGSGQDGYLDLAALVALLAPNQTPE